MPGAVVSEFPAIVHAWHARDDDDPSTDLHKSSHIFVKGPDGKWLDGSVHVGEVVGFLADYPERLSDGSYHVWSTAHWKDGLREHEYDWEFTLTRAPEDQLK